MSHFQRYEKIKKAYKRKSCLSTREQESRSSAGNCHAEEPAGITQLSSPWSRDSAGTDHVADHTLITWLIMHWSRDWSCTDHIIDPALITWLITHRSGGWSDTYHVTDHALITWLLNPISDKVLYPKCAHVFTQQCSQLWNSTMFQ